MRIGQQARVTSERYELTNKIGIVEDILEHRGRQWYGLRLPPPYHEVLIWFKIWEIARTGY